LNDLASDFPKIVEGLAMVLEKWHAGGEKVRDLGLELDLDSLDEKTKELLRSLGYIK
jgi:hypothetical protein